MRRSKCWLVSLLFSFTAAGQVSTPEHHHGGTTSNAGDRTAMQHQAHGEISDDQGPGLVQQILSHHGAGTSAGANSTSAAVLMTSKAGWTFMFHGQAFLADVQQSGPRGKDKLFSTNWLMPMAQRRFGRSEVTFRTMLSLEPATVTKRFYPVLFQQGETAFGQPIKDGQHPHDFFMEIAALYDFRTSRNTLLSFYAAPIGDPALGPSAYSHRASASENPMATLGHHLQDSSHILSDVLTGGFTFKNARVEFSGFHGREPDEFRWNIDSGVIDSWSGRLTLQAGRNWSAQYSFGHLTSPEELHPDEDVQRMTASVMYNLPLTNGEWTSTLLWGRNRALPTSEKFNAYLAESTLHFAGRERVWTRIENVDRTTDLLATPPAGDEHFLARIQAYTLGYDHELKLVPKVSAAVGGQLTFYGKPVSLDALYGRHPLGAVFFLRLRPIGSMHSH